MRSRMIAALLLVLLFFMGRTAVRAVPESLPSFRLLIAANAHDLQIAVQEASGRYAVAFGAPASGLVVLRQLDPFEMPPSYRVVEGGEAIESALSRGYRPVPATFDAADGRVALIVRRTREGASSSFLLLHSDGTNSFDQMIRQAETRGFRVIGIAGDDSNHYWALLEPRDASGEDTAPAALVVSGDADYLQRKLDLRADAGYRIVQTSAAWRLALLSLERGAGSRRDTARVDYLVLSATQNRQLETQMNLAAARGYRYTPGTMQSLHKLSLGWLGGLGSEFIAVMEARRSRQPRCKYLVLADSRSSTLSQKFDAAVEKGFTPVGLTPGTSDRDRLILLERR